MCINFKITLFGLRGMLQHIFDCLYITGNMSDTTDQIFTKPMGICTSLFCSGIFKFALDWSDGGYYIICLLVIDWPKGGQCL